MQMFLVATVVVGLAAFGGALAAPAGDDAGAQLAHQLGLDDPLEAQRAVEELGTAQRLGYGTGSDEPLDEDLLAKKAAASEKLSSASPQEALESITQLTKELDAQLKLTKAGNGLLALAAEAHLDRANALKLANRPIEALVEAQKVRSICSRASCQVNANSVIHSIEDELASKDNYAVFGLTAGASQSEVNKARKGLLLLVHPDKNGGVDKQSSNYLQHLYDRIETAHKAILSGQQK